MFSLLHTLIENAETYASKEFIFYEKQGSSITYDTVLKYTVACKKLFQSLHLSRGNKVVCILDNHWMIYPLLFAGISSDIMIAPLNFNLHADELKEILTDLNHELIIYESDNYIENLENQPKISIDKIFYLYEESALTDIFRQHFRFAPASSKPLLTIFSSGSTGKSKGIILSETNLIAAATNFLSTYPVTMADRFICIMPCFHMNGLMLTGIIPFIAGARVMLCRSFKFDSAKFYLDNIRKYGVTVLSVTPSIMAIMMRIFRPVNLQQVRAAFCGVAPLHEHVWRAFENHFNVPVYQGYGLTETTFWATMTPPAMKLYHTVGNPVNCRIKIDSPSPEQSGEILISGSIVMHGYLNADPLSDDHFFPTGDIGCVDTNGQLIINGRIKDLIIRNGINIFPKSIDNALIQHSQLVDCATVGLPAVINGEIVCTAVVAKNTTAPPTEHSLREWLSERISSIYLPDRICFIDSIPKTSTGKIARTELICLLNNNIKDKVIKRINNRKILRRHIAEDGNVADYFAGRIQKGLPIQLIKYWGAGNRSQIEDVDRKAIDRIGSMIRMIESEYSAGVECTFIFTHMHARINGKHVPSYEAYFSGIGDYIWKMKIASISTEKIWEEEGDSFENLYRYAHTQEAVAHWQTVTIKDELLLQAGKHSLVPDRELAAKLYYYANQRERKYIVKKYPDSVFLTYNKSDSHNVLLPELPTLYLHVPHKPWFS